MKYMILGTAGHIDHGKTTLIKALTGQNTDRWKEERRRGITIDLGFAYFDLKNGDRVGIVDVPGHEKFIKNMVAGVAGMDLVMLVIAADEGIMPQTREHVNILELLGIKKSVIVLNKCDLVNEEWLELVEEEIREEFTETFLEQMPVVRVSAVTGEGLERLTHTIESFIREEGEKRDALTLPRLPIDRVFSLSGFGTIVTGTLLSGTLAKEDVLEIYPIKKECRIRQIQVHGQSKDRCYAGQRVAINLSNVKKKEISRGCVVAPKNRMNVTELLDVKLTVLADSMRIVKNRERFHLYTGTSEILCRAILLDKEEIAPGESGLVQLRLEQQLAVKRGDRFVVRFYSPLETIGGGVILEANPIKKKRFDKAAIEALEKKAAGTVADVMEVYIKEYADNMVTLAELAKSMAYSEEELGEYVEELVVSGRVYAFPVKKINYLWHRDNECILRGKLQKELRSYHARYPYRYGMKRAEVYRKYLKKVKPLVFDAYVERMIEEGIYGCRGDYLYVSEFTVAKDSVYREIETLLMDQFLQVGYQFFKLSEVNFGQIAQETVEDVLHILLEEQEIVRVNEDVFTMKRLIDEAKERIQEQLNKSHLITIAQVRDMFNTSRKSAKLILQYMDAIKVTKKIGGESERVAY